MAVSNDMNDTNSSFQNDTDNFGTSDNRVDMSDFASNTKRNKRKKEKEKRAHAKIRAKAAALEQKQKAAEEKKKKRDAVKQGNEISEAIVNKKKNAKASNKSQKRFSDRKVSAVSFSILVFMVILFFAQTVVLSVRVSKMNKEIKRLKSESYIDEISKVASEYAQEGATDYITGYIQELINDLNERLDGDSNSSN